MNTNPSRINDLIAIASRLDQGTLDLAAGAVNQADPSALRQLSQFLNAIADLGPNGSDVALPVIGDALGRRTQLDPHGVRYGDEVPAEPLVDCAAFYGKPPTFREYNKWRAALGDGRARAIPHGNTYRNHFPSWDEALREAGLDPSLKRRTAARR